MLLQVKLGFGIYADGLIRSPNKLGMLYALYAFVACIFRLVIWWLCARITTRVSLILSSFFDSLTFTHVHGYPYRFQCGVQSLDSIAPYLSIYILLKLIQQYSQVEVCTLRR